MIFKKLISERKKNKCKIVLKTEVALFMLSPISKVSTFKPFEQTLTNIKRVTRGLTKYNEPHIKNETCKLNT